MEVKDKLWEQLDEVTENSASRLLVLGDLNGKKGRKDEVTRRTIGRHGENIRNNNGRRLIDFCMINNLIITHSRT